MAFSTLTPPKPPSREDGSGRAQTNSRDLISTFGDGYVQAAADGLNNQSRTVPLVWAYLSGTDADTLCGFFDSVGRNTPFNYQLPWESSSRQWRLGGGVNTPIYVRDEGRGLTTRVEVTFAEDFSL